MESDRLLEIGRYVLSLSRKANQKEVRQCEQGRRAY